MRFLLAMLLPLTFAFLPGCPSGGDDDDDNDSAGDDDLAPGEGYTGGDTLPNCSLTNQDGGSAKVHDAAGDRVLVVVSAEWCEPCAESADDAQALYDTLSAEFGFTMYETLIQDGSYNDAVSESVLQSWYDTHGMTTLDVWTDGLESCIDPFTTGELPVFVIADEDLVIHDVISNGYNESVETQVIDALRGL